MTKLEEGLNKKFGRLTPVEIIKEKGKNSKYRCVCDCGNEIITWYNNLYLGKTVSCGCWNDEQRRRKENKSHNIKHGMANTRIYREWCAMRNRCTNKSNISYINYGGRGISVCDEWLNDFVNFYNWAMANGYKDDLTIDRIDVNGNYEPSNCRFISNKEQQMNKRMSCPLFDEELVNLLEQKGYKFAMLKYRMKKYGCTYREAIEMRKWNRYDFEIKNEYNSVYKDIYKRKEERDKFLEYLKTI